MRPAPLAPAVAANNSAQQQLLESARLLLSSVNPSLAASLAPQPNSQQHQQGTFPAATAGQPGSAFSTAASDEPGSGLLTATADQPDSGVPTTSAEWPGFSIFIESTREFPFVSDIHCC